MSAPVTRERFAGTIKIIQFNLQFYAASLLTVVIITALLAFQLVPQRLELALLLAAAAVIFWTVSSLAVSWYVYDHIRVTRWRWIPDALSIRPRRWVNIHAGLDESTAILRQLFPGTDGLVIDIYDSGEMTEPSIARARRIYPSANPFVAAKFDNLPLPAGDRDTVFLLFAAHELRALAHRIQLFRELARVLQNDGQVILVEHLRDWRNFLAFGPGFLHFWSGREWRQTIRHAGLRIERESCNTPFVRCFLLRNANA
jgi:SAM-dependent methyltransferase